MVFKIEYSEQAAVDLADIIRYLTDELYNLQAAERFYNVVSEKLGFLRDNPYIYPLHHDEKLRTEEYHFVVIGNYSIFYLIHDDSSIVSIARIVFGGRDLSAVFEE